MCLGQIDRHVAQERDSHQFVLDVRLGRPLPLQAGLEEGREAKQPPATLANDIRWLGLLSHCVHPSLSPTNCRSLMHSGSSQPLVITNSIVSTQIASPSPPSFSAGTAFVPTWRATVPPPSERKETSTRPARRINSASSPAVGKAATERGR